MPLPTSVVLMPGVRPRFPDACVGCNRPHPETTFRIADRALVWLSVLWPPAYFVGRRVVHRVPSCRTCRRFQHGVVWMRSLGAWLLVIAGVFLWMPWVRSLELAPAVEKLVLFGVVVPLLVPLLIWERLLPPAAALDVSKSGVEFEFREPEYAEAFAAANANHVVSIERG